MNTPDHNVDKTAEHEGLIKTPKQLITTIILAFIVPIAVILLLIRLVTASSPLGVGSDAQSQEAVAKRIQPVAGFALVGAEATTGERTGEQVYAATCAACHGTGVAGAHKVGDNAAWAPILAKGFDTMLHNAVNGLNAMPPRGGNPALSDLEVARAIVHMVNQSGADLPEPEAGTSNGAAPEANAEAKATDAAPAAQAPAAAPAAPATGSESAAPASESAATASDGAAVEQAAAPAEANVAAAATATAAASQAGAAAAAPAAPQAAAPAGDIDLAAGEKLYKSVCFACHNFGVAGAPKFGDKAVWAPLIANGMDQMIKISIEGKGAMPPRGGSTASDEAIIAAVHYMVNAAQ